MPATLERSATMTSPSPAAVKAAKRRILLVDDDSANRQTLFRLLTDDGYLVVTAITAKEALELARAMTLDLVLLDLNLPVKDGWNAFEQLSLKNPLLPVVLITTCPGEFVSTAASSLGVLLEKPLNFKKLFSTIRMLLEEPAEIRMARWRMRTSIFCYIPSHI